MEQQILQSHNLIEEAVRAAIWTTVGLFPMVFGLGVHLWADVRSLKKAMNAAFQKIRDLEEEKNG